MADALLYKKHIGLVQLLGLNKEGRPNTVTCIKQDVPNPSWICEVFNQAKKAGPIELNKQKVVDGATTSWTSKAAGLESQ